MNIFMVLCAANDVNHKTLLLVVITNVRQMGIVNVYLVGMITIALVSCITVYIQGIRVSL